ncbi:unnamed protein product [Lathyrus oleraceus]|uniref:uncharacterized protein LOC127085192 n=1 Tax=Pisum sativum TaxID=3888 RepID=UPI001FC4C20C|nr:uncharacterized protein LOC127085192 [Pisum sativum]
MATFSFQQLHQFHTIDRKIFSVLVMSLARDPSQSLLVMALWLWLENLGYPSLILKLVSCHRGLINDVAQEAVSCLDCLELENFPIPNDGGLFITRILMGRKISLHLFKYKRFTIITGIKNVLNKICSRIFNDILLHVLGSSSVCRLLLHYPYRLVIVPGFPHKVFGEFTISPTKFEKFDLNDGVILKSNLNVSDQDKTIFLTFSKGFSVSEKEVRYLFTSTFEVDCIKTIVMGNRNSDGQVLYATMVLNHVETLDRILNGRHVAKFRVNGRHIWARKYDRRD